MVARTMTLNVVEYPCTDQSQDMATKFVVSKTTASFVQM